MNIRDQRLAPQPPWGAEAIRPVRFHQAMEERAQWLGLRFVARPDREGFAARPDSAAADPATPGGLSHLTATIRSGSAVLAHRGPERVLLVAPDTGDMARIAERLDETPALARSMAVTTPASIRRMLVGANARLLAADAITRLWRNRPDLSARQLTTPLQAVSVIAMLALALLAIVLTGWTAVAVIDVLIGLLFLSIIMLRLLALSIVVHRTGQHPAQSPPVSPASLPIYSVLLPLHDEPHMVSDLVAAIERLEWPRDRLDVKLILEADDARTLAAVAALRLTAPFEVIRVPRLGPRTKPKALAFALPLARGDYVTVYDAEDRPHPKQLLEAHLAFSKAEADVACLQSPLLIDNAGSNGLTALFALEYSVQFDGVLPLLSALRLPLPLGGTSNHFRREALERVGGWDPYNVTEDADLGIRLARFGYRSAVLELPTLEEAPRTVRTWLTQRTRWLKGWMQTFLVHMRAPRRLMRDIGPRRFAGFVLTSFGALVAAAIHPVYLATVIAALIDPSLLWRSSSSPAMAAMTALNCFNFVGAYAVFALLSRETFRLRRIKRPAGALVYLPAYWLLLSLACYRALIELLLAPHHWSKTPHVGRTKAQKRSTARDAVIPPPGRAGAALSRPAEKRPALSERSRLSRP